MKRALLIVPAVLLLAGGAAYLLLRDRTPLLTREALEKNRKLWEEKGFQSYDLELVVRRDVPPEDRYRAEVRDGKVVRLEHNGTVLPNPSQQYSIEGLFEILEREMEMAEASQVPTGARKGATLKARFHPRLGYPLVFKALAPKRMSVFIEVLRVVPRPS